VLKAYTDQDEAYMVAASILARQYASHAVYSDFAILYRTNAQSRTFEEAFRKRNIPYKIFGGISFYERAEIKDILAYLRLVVNPRDDEAFKRVVNVPARGIGGTTLMRLQSAASKRQTSLWEQIEEGNLTEHGVKPATEKRLLAFKEVISELALQQFTSQAYDFAMEVVRKSGYMAELEGDRSIEGKTRMENVGEFFNSIKKIAETENVEEEMTIHPFLANVALITDLEEQDDPLGERVKLMTVHAAKGLEFNYVYVVGLEEELFPSSKVTERPQELEEERRLFYVALTRAKKGVSLSFAKMRYKWGKQSKSRPSRFLKEIDSKWLSKRVEDEPESDAPDRRFERRGSFSDSHFEKRTFPSVSRVSQSNKPVFSQRPTSIASPANASDSGFVPDDPALFKAGQSVEHASFGRGAILSIEGRSVSERKAVVRFDGSGTKTLLLKFARMRVVSGE
jgi:DNA helicase-2/ATP-dependent DNA helicase PcrA